MSKRKCNNYRSSPPTNHLAILRARAYIAWFERNEGDELVQDMLRRSFNRYGNELRLEREFELLGEGNSSELTPRQMYAQTVGLILHSFIKMDKYSAPPEDKTPWLWECLENAERVIGSIDGLLKHERKFMKKDLEIDPKTLQTDALEAIREIAKMPLESEGPQVSTTSGGV